MKEPGPDHPITIEPEAERVRVTFNGKTIADTTRALSMKEADYPAVPYVPIEDVDQSVLAETEHSSHCPFKGDASYFSIRADGREAENAIWFYKDPFPAVAEIRGHVAFYPNRVDSIEIG